MNKGAVAFNSGLFFGGPFGGELFSDLAIRGFFLNSHTFSVCGLDGGLFRGLFFKLR